MTDKFPYEVRVAPGCTRGPDRSVVSRHRTLAAAVRKARKCDRVIVERSDSSTILYQAQSQQPTRYGYGLYGGPDTRPLAECLREAAETERDYRAR